MNRGFKMSYEPTIRIVDVFSVLMKNEAEYTYYENQERKRLSQEKPNFCDCEEDLLVTICLKMETCGSNSEAELDINTNGSIVNTDSAEPSSSSDLPSNEPDDKVMSQALDLRLQINTIDDGIEQQVPKFDNSNTEAQYKFIKVKEHVRKIKVGARKKSVDLSMKSRPTESELCS